MAPLPGEQLGDGFGGILNTVLGEQPQDVELGLLNALERQLDDELRKVDAEQEELSELLGLLRQVQEKAVANDLVSAEELRLLEDGAEAEKTLQPVSSKRNFEEITILHFNDVYNIEPGAREPVGGAARFVSFINQVRESGADPLVLFSGDAFSPSTVSTFTEGEQMPPVLNLFGIDVACIGNHDFDFGMEVMQDLMSKTNFPWLCTNCDDTTTQKPIGGCLDHLVVDWKGARIGFVGLVEGEWLETLGAVDPSILKYTDFVEAGRRWAKKLKEDDGCDIVIALTHMRVPNDRRLADEAPEIDLVLGGHDHHYVTFNSKTTGTLVVKSGTDFRTATVLKVKPAVTPQDGGEEQKTKCKLEVISMEKAEIDSSIEENAECKGIVDMFYQRVKKELEKEIGGTVVDLEGRFSKIRTEETNLGNFVSDILRASTDADMALLNSGNLRSDMVHPAGVLTNGDLMRVLPIVDELVVIGLTGDKVYEALENSVCAYPKLEGRFLQVSGLSFAFDPNCPPGQRVDRDSIRVGGSPSVQFEDGEPLDPERVYRVAIKAYVYGGHDGFTCFQGAPLLTSAECIPPLLTMLRNHFVLLNAINEEHHRRLGRFFRKAANKIHHKAEVLKEAKDPMLACEAFLRSIHVKLDDPGHVGKQGAKPQDVKELHDKGLLYVINPTVEGRIRNLAVNS